MHSALLVYLKCIIILLVRYLRTLLKKPEICTCLHPGINSSFMYGKQKTKSELSQIVLTSLVLSKRDSDWFLSVIVLALIF